MKKKTHRLTKFLSAIMLGALSPAVFCQQNADVQRMMNSQEINDLAKRQQAQAKATIDAVAHPTATAQAHAFVNSEAVANEQKRQAELNKKTVNSVTDESVNQMRMSLPKLAQFGGQLKFGSHITVSSEGEAIIALIRSLTNAQPAERDSVLKKLQDYARRGDPEAVHFFGFVFENGLFGAKKDSTRAEQFYKAAASHNYQPSVFNLALAQAYGRLGNKQDPAKARALAYRAHAINLEHSGRVCGLAAFLSFRNNDQTNAMKFAKGCSSPLAHLPRAAWGKVDSLPETVTLLRDSLATGADDGYALLEAVSKPFIGNDPNYTFCKYALVNRYKARTDFPRLREAATQCVDQMIRVVPKNSQVVVLRDQVIGGIAGFVPTEISAINAMRKSNKFHFAWSVPYLPFPQAEADLFEPIMPKDAP